jgi:hypothetical protein
VGGGAEREDALLGAALLLVAARAAEGRVEAVFVQRLRSASVFMMWVCSDEPCRTG